MPLARIFTHHPERTTSLSEELQQQGYQVEVRSPDQTHLAPADLEIEFEICDRADVLKRAATLGDELHADVAVAPGVLAPSAQIQPAAQIQPPAEIQPAARKVQQVPAEALPQEAAAPEPSTQELDREREFEAAFARTGQPAEEQMPVIEHPAEAAEEAGEEYSLPPVAFLEEPAPMRAEPVIVPVHESAIPEETSQPAAREEAARPAAMTEAARPVDPVPYLAQWKPFSTPSSHAPAEERRSIFAESRREDRTTEPAPAQPAAPGISRSAASIFSTAMAGAKGMSASAAESFREWLQEYKKRAQVRKAEARAARVARMLDLEQRKAEAQQRAAELEAAREAAAARLVELVRQRDPGLPKESLPKETLPQESFARERFSDDRKAAAEPYFRPAPQRTPMESLRHASIERMQAKPRRPMSPQLRAVLTGAAAISILFVIGIVLGELYPRAPLASPTEHSASGVTVQTGAPAAQSGGVTVKTAPQGRPAPQPSAAVQAPAQEKPSPRVSQTRHVAAQQGENAIGDDVVIRHYSRPVPTEKPRQSGQQAGLKHFSDMEN
jgi:hypothetical protein